jgi:thiamine-monophosphate kinase
LRPEARRDIVRLLRELGVKPTSMIDISDGLGSELLHLCRQSGTGATIYEAKLNIDPTVVTVAGQFKISSLSMALNGGEDYELLFTVPLEAYDKVKERKDIAIIGHMSEKSGGVNVIAANGSQFPVDSLGFNHFGDGRV